MVNARMMTTSPARSETRAPTIDAGEDVAPDLIGAEEVLPVGGLELLRDVQRPRAHPGGRGRRMARIRQLKQHDNDRQPDHREWTLPEAGATRAAAGRRDQSGSRFPAAIAGSVRTRVGTTPWRSRPAHARVERAIGDVDQDLMTLKTNP